MSETVLIAGGNGFVGSYICRYLVDSGRRVVLYDMVPASPPRLFIQGQYGEAIRYANGQVTDLPRVLDVCKEADVKVIVHTALGGGPDQPFQTYQANTVSTAVMCEAARSLGLRRVILMSTQGVYQRVAYEPMDENHSVFSPRNGSLMGHYGASKLAAEVMGFAYHDYEGVDFLALRMSAVYGFGMRIPLYLKPMIENALRGEPTVFAAGGDMRRDFTYVRDSASAVVQAVGADHARLTQLAYNVSGGRVYTMREAAAAVREVMPEAQIQIGPGLSGEEERDVLGRGVLDLTKARQDLGYTPCYDLAQGIADYVATARAFAEASGGRLVF